MSPIRPITLLTGFLGAGKTTIVNKLLADPRHAQTAVIVNEIAGIGLDRSLIAAVKGQVIEMTTGCLCCSAGGDVTHALLDLAKRAEHYEINPFAHVIIETTGLADPAPLVPQLMLDRRIAAVYRLLSIVTVVDVVQGDTQLDRYAEAVSQVKLADTVLLTKSDLATDPVSKREAARLVERLRALNASAVVADVHDRTMDLVTLLERQPLSRRQDAIAGWLGVRATAVELGAPASRRAITRHSEAISAHSIELPTGLAEAEIVGAVDRLLRSAAPRILRLKGLVATAELPDRPLVLHGVGRYLNEPMRLETWPSQQRRSVLVVITDGMDEAAVRQHLGFEAMTGEPVS